MKVFKHLKKHILILFLIIALIAVQAQCDLALPTYTSNIINIGVSSKGIDQVTPDVIRKSELDKLLLFMNNEEIEVITTNYKEINKDNFSSEEYKEYIKKYPLSSKEKVMLLTTKDSSEVDKLNKILAKPMLIIFSIDNSESSMMGNEMSIELPEGMDLYTALSVMPEEQKKDILENINTKFEEIPEVIINQAATNCVYNEYKSIGIDTDKLQTDYIVSSGAKMLGIALISLITTVMVGLLGSRIAARFAKDLRVDVYKKTLSFSSSEVNNFGTASLITRTTNDIQQIQMLIVMTIRIVVYSPIIATGALIKVINSNASMTWIIGLAVAIIISIVATMFTLAVPRFNKVQKLVDKLNLVSREIISGIPVIRAFSNQRHEEKRFKNVNNDLTKTNLFIQRLMSGMMPLMMLVMNGISLLIVWNGAHGIESGAMQLGDMMAFIQYAMQIIMAFLMISMISIILPRAIVSAKRINEVLVKKNKIKDPKKPKSFVESEKGIVEFKNVDFRYHDASENVISDISFKVNKGETIAFIGSTGSGKSTLINLIPRLFDVTNGTITVNGVNIKDVTQHDLHKVIGYIPQKGVLFSGDIESNIKYGDESISEEAMKKSAKIAQATEFIESKKDKYQEVISQGGTNVSGGQKQRLSIARAIAKNPDIYIFDDSFSALDFKTDAALRKALKEELSDKTIMIVAQRISTIMHADKIVVLDDGKMAGIGTHEQLLKKCKVYKEIASSQLTKEELANEK